jgi:Fe(3+) dicitrate transport protein
VGDAYGDASNEKISSDPVAGYIPAYTVLDFSATYKIKNYTVKIGVNNLSDKAYFTRRTDEYPGPGIIPAVGRSFYVGFSAKF